MNKKMIVLSLTGLLFTGGIFGASNAFAAEANTPGTGTHVISKQLKQTAAHFGINIDGKSKQEVQKEIRKAKKDKQSQKLMKLAKKVGVQASGKDVKEIRKEVKEAIQKKHIDQLYNVAKRLGVSTDGKSVDQIKKEVKDARVAKKQQNQQVRPQV
ncbi:hypothetical protein [Ectobacillus polymachus]|uniref:hypothetical protein n=1 Tax=Ectobacillus polymachus TaxID=1508806 RepID=UPI003A8B8A5F